MCKVYSTLINEIKEARKKVRETIREQVVKADSAHEGWDEVCHLLHLLECDVEESRRIAQFKASDEGRL